MILAHVFYFYKLECILKVGGAMAVREDVKQLLARENRTMTWLATEITKISGKKYSLKSISDKLARKTLQYEEFTLILKILNYEMKFEKIKD